MRRTLETLCALAARLLPLLLAAPCLYADELAGSLPCGGYRILRTDGGFEAEMCRDDAGQALRLRGSYDTQTVLLSEIAVPGLYALSTNAVYPFVDAAAWNDVIPRLGTLAAAARQAMRRLHADGVDTARFHNLRQGGEPCNVAGPAVHIIDAPLHASRLHVPAGCAVLAQAAVVLERLELRGWFYSDSALEAGAALVLGSAEGGTFAVDVARIPVLTLTDARFGARSLETDVVEAANSQIALAEQLNGASNPRVWLAHATLSAKMIEAGNIELTDRAELMISERITAAALRLDSARAGAREFSLGILASRAGEVNAGVLSTDTVTLDGGRLTAAEVTARRMEARRTDIVAEAIRSAYLSLNGGTYTTRAAQLGVNAVEAHVLGGAEIGAARITLAADTLILDHAQLNATERVAVTIAERSDIAASLVRAPFIDASLGDSEVDGASQFIALPVTPPQTGNILFDDGKTVFADTSGGSHGGYGGTSGSLAHNRFVPAQPPLGDPRVDDASPGVPGFGGDPAGPQERYSAGGYGAGRISLHARHLRWDGAAIADGASAHPRSWAAPVPYQMFGGGGGGGSGGTIAVDATGTLTGSGKFQANGGLGSYAGAEFGYVAGGGGSGGRILVRYGRQGVWTGTAQALGGAGGSYNPDALRHLAVPPWHHALNHGGPGSVYWQPSAGPGTLVIDGSGGPGGVGYLSGDFATDDIVIRAATVATRGLKAQSLTLADGAVLAADNPRLRLHWPPPVRYGTVPERDAPVYPIHLYPLDSVRRVPLDAVINLAVTGPLAIDASSRIDLSGQGGYGIKEPQADDRSGGAHGGEGGQGGIAPGGVAVIASYGDPRRPVAIGQGGAGALDFDDEDGHKCGVGGSGGGALRLNVGGIMHLDGAIRTDGYAGHGGRLCPWPEGTGGGAGGSVWLTANGVIGSGLISASGGPGGEEPPRYGGGGGGGRIAVYTDLNDFHGEITAAGGGPDADVLRRGGDGTVVLAAALDVGETTARGAAANVEHTTGGGACVLAPLILLLTLLRRVFVRKAIRL